MFSEAVFLNSFYLIWLFLWRGNTIQTFQYFCRLCSITLTSNVKKKHLKRFVIPFSKRKDHYTFFSRKKSVWYPTVSKLGGAVFWKPKLNKELVTFPAIGWNLLTLSGCHCVSNLPTNLFGYFSVSSRAMSSCFRCILLLFMLHVEFVLHLIWSFQWDSRRTSYFFHCAQVSLKHEERTRSFVNICSRCFNLFWNSN